MGALDTTIKRLLKLQKTRIVAFGSSNTEARNAQRLNWFDWLDCGIAQYYGRVHTSINTGISGNSTRDLIARFDDDVAMYSPHLVIITVGGNDANPEREISEDEYRDNLAHLARSIRAIEGTVLLQTYYACDLERMDPAYAVAFQRYMDIVRETAAKHAIDLVDHHRRWKRLRMTDLNGYRALMHDPMHVKPLGNILMGLDLCRAFRVKLGPELTQACAEGLALQAKVDALEKAEKPAEPVPR